MWIYSTMLECQFVVRRRFVSWLPSSSLNRRLGILLEEVGVKDYGDGEQFQETKVRQIHR